MSEENSKFYTFSVDRIKNKLHDHKTIADDPTINKVKEIIEDLVIQFSEKVKQRKINLAPKDFEKFAKLYLTIINQENIENTGEEDNAKKIEQTSKEFEAIKDSPSFIEIKDQMEKILNKRNQNQ